MPLNNPAAAAEIKTGTYTGNVTANRAIPHGLAGIPKAVIIVDDTGDRLFNLNVETADIHFVYVTASGKYTVTAMDGTNFYVGNVTSYPNSANETAYNYDWVAFT